MKKILFLCFVFFNLALLNAQTIFWTEGFGTSSTCTVTQGRLANGVVTSNGAWTVATSVGGITDDASANQWYISATSSGMASGACTSGCLVTPTLLNNTLHIGNVSSSPTAGFFCPTGDCGAAYDSGLGLSNVTTSDQAQSPVINCTGKNNITLSFDFTENGQAGVDFMQVIYSANGGTTWSSLGTPTLTGNGSCPNFPPSILMGEQEGLWGAYTVALPATANNNANIKIGFWWQNNDDGVGTDPSIAIDSIKLSVPSSANPVVTITPSPATAICQSSTLTLNGSATNGPITAWSWSVTPSAGVTVSPSATSQSVTATFTTTGTYTFTLAATNSVGIGTQIQTITVSPTATPSVSINANPGNPICAGQTVTLTATPTNGGAAPLYQWQVNGVNLGTNTTAPTFTATAVASSETVSVILTSNATCVSTTTILATDTILISTPQTPSVSITPTLATGVCSGGSVPFTATPAIGGSTPLYQWQVNGVNVGTNTTTPTFTLTNVVATETVSVSLTSNAGCVTTNTATSSLVTVTITPTPTVSITKGFTHTVCPTVFDTIIATGTPGSTFNWTPAAGLNVTNNDTVMATNAALGVYTYYVTSTVGGCTSAKDSATVTVSSTFTASAGLSHTICEGQTTTLSALGGTSYTWTPSSTLSCSVCVNPVATPSTMTIYTVVATKAGCTAVSYDTVYVNPSAIASFVDTVTVTGIPQTLTFINLSSNATGYIWNFGVSSNTLVQNTISNPSYTYSVAGTYTVTLIAFGANGCNDTIHPSITILDIASLSMPNIFTPNGDDINDVFAPIAHGMKSLACTIFDRWGIKVITLDNMNNAYWDGHTTSGIACSEGTYFYIVTATDINNKSYNLKGFLQLIR